MPTEVKAPITGNVCRIVAQPGQTVAKFDPILVLESMKMEIPVEAPKDGKILEIKVKEGDSVIENDVVAIME